MVGVLHSLGESENGGAKTGESKEAWRESVMGKVKQKHYLCTHVCTYVGLYIEIFIRSVKCVLVGKNEGELSVFRPGVSMQVFIQF